MPIVSRLLLLAIVILLSGCSATAMRERGWDDRVQSKAERLLLEGLRLYEDGQLKKAGESLTAALSEGLSFTRDKVTAYKYLAFVDCSTGRQEQCREDFSAALALDPDFELTSAEVGHPSWGPVYRAVKARRAKK